MDRTERYQERTTPAERRGPWVLLLAWPEVRVVPMPAGKPLGRAHLARFGIDDPLVSAKHCRLAAAEDGYHVEDLGSTNGTWVDGVRIAQATKLRDGSVLRVGRQLFVVRRTGQREPAAPLDAGPAGMIVAPFALRAVRAALDALARSRPANVLVLGETGTGKEAIARIAAMRVGRDRPFETVNASAYRTESFDGAFFGHERGAFTGAHVAHGGIVAAADGGALFLDELGDMPKAFQPLLLRFLETREVRRLGAARATRADLLVVAATNHDLEREIADGVFRADLLARFEAPYLRLPPLRERPEDLPSIARALVTGMGGDLDAETDVSGVERLMLEPHPLNVRGLRALLQEARTEGGLHGADLDARLSRRRREPDEETIRAAIAEHGSERKAAEALGVTRRKVRNAKGGATSPTRGEASAVAGGPRDATTRQAARTRLDGR